MKQISKGVESAENESLNAFWMNVARICEKRGLIPLNKLPEPAYLHVGPWRVWINGTPFTCEVIADTETQRKVRVERLIAYVEFNGWPAGLLHPLEGSFVSGEEANIEALVDALGDL